MTAFAVNPQRLDPYKSCKFQVILDGKPIPGITRVSALRRRTETVLHRDGGFPNHFVTAPGLTSFEPILLERGVTHDSTLEDWAAHAYNPADSAMSLRNLRKDMRINLLDEQGTVVISYMVYRCWVAGYQALAQLDSNGSSIALESVLLSHEGFERDRSVTEPAET
jgi:phage tail-like protein